MITTFKWLQLKKRMLQLDIHELYIEEKFIIGSGKGGQKLQKTASCVYLIHKPTSIEVKCQKSRSREENRYHARKRLCEKMETLLNQEKSQKQQEVEKIRRQKRKRTKRAQKKRLAAKNQRALLKKQRQLSKDDLE